MGWGGKRETNHAKSVQESLSAAWLDFQDGHGKCGSTFSSRIRATEQKQTKKYLVSRLHTLHYVKQKGVDHKYSDALFDL